MLSLTALEVIVSLLAVRAVAQSSPVQLCTGELCDNCPAAIASVGPPQGEGCVIYDREVVLGGAAGEFPPEINGRREIYFDISASFLRKDENDSRHELTIAQRLLTTRNANTCTLRIKNWHLKHLLTQASVRSPADITCQSRLNLSSALL